MVQHWPVLFLFFLSWQLHAQDERYYRQMLAGDLPELLQEVKETPVTPFVVEGPLYSVDLNQDGHNEALQPLKRDGVDWLIIHDSTKRKIFEGKILATGGESAISKIRLVQLSPKVRALIVYLDEGATRGKAFESTAKLFVLSFEDSDLSTLSLVPGPHFYHEREAQREQYLLRDYQVTVADLNGDGTREITVHYNHIQRVMEYQGKGQWKRY